MIGLQDPYDAGRVKDRQRSLLVNVDWTVALLRAGQLPASRVSGIPAVIPLVVMALRVVELLRWMLVPRPDPVSEVRQDETCLTRRNATPLHFFDVQGPRLQALMVHGQEVVFRTAKHQHRLFKLGFGRFVPADLCRPDVVSAHQLGKVSY